MLLARLGLAAVFVFAGLTKLADRPGTRQTVVDFGVPRRLAASVTLLLPLAEVALGVALLVDPWASAGAVGAICLLSLFCGAIAANLARGRVPDCRCFGQVRPTPVGGKTLLRNGVLMAVAAGIVWQGPGELGDAGGWVGDLGAADLVAFTAIGLLTGLVGIEAWLISRLIGQNGRFLRRLDAVEAAVGLTPRIPAEGLAPGTAAPGFELPDIAGRTVGLSALTAEGKPVMLIFTSPDCAPCVALLPEIGRWQSEHAERLTIALISRPGSGDERTAVEEHEVRHVLIQADGEVDTAYGAVLTPSAMVIEADGTVGSALVAGPDAIRGLVVEWASLAPVRSA